MQGIWFDGNAPTQCSKGGDFICNRVPLAVVVKFVGFDKPIPVARSADTLYLKEDTATCVRRLQIPLVPDYGTTAHGSQGATLDSVMVDLNLPDNGDGTAAYVALSRVRRREDLSILRAFDPDSVRRSGVISQLSVVGRLLLTSHSSEFCRQVVSAEPKNTIK